MAGIFAFEPFDQLADCIDCLAGRYSAVAGSNASVNCIGCPGGKYVRDMLRAKAIYNKSDMEKLYDDLEKYTMEKRNKLAKLQITS